MIPFPLHRTRIPRQLGQEERDALIVELSLQTAALSRDRDVPTISSVETENTAQARGGRPEPYSSKLFSFAAESKALGPDAEVRLALETAGQRFRKMGAVAASAARRRLHDFLQRRGFSAPAIHAALDSFFD